MKNITEETVGEESSIRDAKENDMSSLGNDLQNFVDNITSISGTLEITMQAIFKEFTETKKRVDEFNAEIFLYEEETGETTILLRPDFYKTIIELTKQLKTCSHAHETIPRGHVMALISQYDAFFGKLLRVILLKKPDILNASDEIFTFAQLVDFGSIEAAKEYILERKIDTVIRRNHAEQFDWMEKQFNIQLRKELDIWSDFIELTERRNLFVHTDGIVSDQYLKVCSKYSASIDETIKGDRLEVTPEYFNKAYNVIFEIAFKLTHVLWRKLIPDELEEADRNLIEIGYNALHDENYRLATMIFDFATQFLKKHSSDKLRRTMVINQALSYKWGGNDKKAREIVANEDWSATSGKYRLAEAVIMGNFESAYAIMQEIGQSDREVTPFCYRDWPLFREIKTENKFLVTFEGIFGESYNKVEPEILSLPGDLASRIMADFHPEEANCV